MTQEQPRQPRESARERNARILRDAFENEFGDLSQDQLKNVVLLKLTEIEDLQDQKKASNDSFKDQIKDKKDAIQYCRERVDFLVGETMVAAANDLLEDEE
jgi:hypothetical protein